MSIIEKVLVVGGGIGGLSTTIALRNAGVEVDVVEKNPAWDVYGVGIIQPGNALRALHRLGLAERAVAEGHPMLGDRTYLGDGKTMLADNEDWMTLATFVDPTVHLPHYGIFEDEIFQISLDGSQRFRRRSCSGRPGGPSSRRLPSSSPDAGCWPPGSTGRRGEPTRAR